MTVLHYNQELVTPEHSSSLISSVELVTLEYSSSLVSSVELVTLKHSSSLVSSVELVTPEHSSSLVSSVELVTAQLTQFLLFKRVLLTHHLRLVPVRFSLVNGLDLLGHVIRNPKRNTTVGFVLVCLVKYDCKFCSSMLNEIRL
jgi:hypothetical protein